MNLEELARRDEHDHPGYSLTAWYDAALPFYKVTLQALFQVEQPLPAIDQYTLRLLDMGISSAHEVSTVLGLDHPVIYATMERLERNGHITIIPADSVTKRKESVSITNSGRALLATLIFLRPEEDTLSLCIDGITGEYGPDQYLLRGRDVRELGLHQVKTYHLPPTLDSLDAVKIRRVWKDNQRGFNKKEKKEFLEVRVIEKAYVTYKNVRVLQYVHNEHGAILLHVYDGAQRTPKHEAALLKMQQEGIQVLQAEKIDAFPTKSDDEINDLWEDLYKRAQRRTIERREIQQAIRSRSQQLDEINTARSTIIPTSDVELQSQTSQEGDPGSQQVNVEATSETHRLNRELGLLQEQLREHEKEHSLVEVLSMTDHRPRLVAALQEANKELIIISPWIAEIAVNNSLVHEIKESLGRGVKVVIGYGFERTPTEDEKRTRRVLEELKKGDKGKNLLLKRLQDTHAKVVVCDNKYMIVTSFNWLSFAGRQDWGNRVELGILTRDEGAIQQMKNRLSSLLQMHLHN